MKLIRHILSHLLLITLLIGVCAVYFYRHQVLPERYVQQIDHYAEIIHPRLVHISSAKIEKQETEQQEVVVAKQKIDVIYVDDVPLVDETSSNNADTQKPKETIEVTEAKQQEPQPQVEETDKIESVKSQSSEVVLQEQQVKTEKIEQEQKAETTEQKTADNEQDVVVTDKQAADYLKVLRDARSAFGQGNMEVAIEKYNELIELEDEADFHGELGNVYYAMGKWQQAGTSYYEAAVRLIDSGQLAQVGYLQRVIQGLDAEHAEKLAKQLANTQGK